MTGSGGFLAVVFNKTIFIKFHIHPKVHERNYLIIKPGFAALSRSSCKDQGFYTVGVSTGIQ